MNQEYKIAPIQDEEKNYVLEQLNEYNLFHAPAIVEKENRGFLNYSIKDNGKVIGGLFSRLGYWGYLEIKILWIHKDYRKKGVGSQLLKYIEVLGRKKGATVSMLDTFSFQAKGFYEKNGYEIFGEIKDAPKGADRFFFKKDLI